MSPRAAPFKLVCYKCWMLPRLNDKFLDIKLLEDFEEGQLEIITSTKQKK